MKKIAIIIWACFFSLSLYSQNPESLEKLTINVAASVGTVVVSISSVAKEKIDGRFYFNSPLEGSQNDPFRHFFLDFFGSSPELEYERFGLGSGVIIDKDGYILTNEHVVSDATQVKVKLSDGREFDAETKGVDKRIDLAVIKINAKNLPVAKLGDSDELKIGQWVLAIGNPFGFAIENPEPTVTVGVVSALGRYLPVLGRRDRGYDDFIQTDAAINPGNSGGPLVNLKGEVIGINTAIITTSGGYQGLGFAIPINKAKKVIDKLAKGEKISYGWLGVNIQDLNEDLRNYFGIKEKEGVIVLKVYKDSPAEKGGIKEGDLILSFKSQPVKTTRELVRMVSSSGIGENIPVKIMRSGKEMLVNITVANMPKETEANAPESTDQDKENRASYRGMTVADLVPFNMQKFNIQAEDGVVVVKIEEGSSAEKSGLRVGDVILKIESKPVKNIGDFKAAVSKIKGACLIKTSRQYFVLKDLEGQK